MEVKGINDVLESNTIPLTVSPRTTFSYLVYDDTGVIAERNIGLFHLINKNKYKDHNEYAGDIITNGKGAVMTAFNLSNASSEDLDKFESETIAGIKEDYPEYDVMFMKDSFPINCTDVYLGKKFKSKELKAIYSTHVLYLKNYRQILHLINGERTNQVIKKRTIKKE